MVKMDHWPADLFPLSHYSADQIKRYCVNNADWQRFRKHCLKGKPTEDKLRLLIRWLGANPAAVGPDGVWMAHCQVTNYINALKRAGILDADLKVCK